ncbi:hypothetical protein BCR34DRAFT_560904 [Clohesyomyces aquaticus]|uniref:Uncharacterized protein n=1 Tax=Clohesyomyces aquaticus TaxID=1231657 RepID=A0A1Y1ZVA7_9PLEO|nr:hypothetical protein BCR34DRAFT_560904 [Clohesyomyces aquaticus]
MAYLLNEVSSELNGHCRPPKTANTTYIVQQCTGGTAGSKPETWNYAGQPTYIITAEALELRYQPLIRYESVPIAAVPTNTSTSAPVPVKIYMRNGIIIGVFVSITILGLCGAIFFVYRRLKRRHGSKTDNENATPPKAMAEATSIPPNNDPTIPIPTGSLLRLAAMRTRGNTHTVRWLKRQAAVSSTASISQAQIPRPPSVSDLESWAPASGGPGTVSPIVESTDHLPLGSKARAIIGGVSIADTSRTRDVEVGEAAASSKSQRESWAAFQARRARIDAEIDRS